MFKPAKRWIPDLDDRVNDVIEDLLLVDREKRLQNCEILIERLYGEEDNARTIDTLREGPTSDGNTAKMSGAAVETARRLGAAKLKMDPFTIVVDSAIVLAVMCIIAVLLASIS
jgi:hypothetical protein